MNNIIYSNEITDIIKMLKNELSRRGGTATVSQSDAEVDKTILAQTIKAMNKDLSTGDSTKTYTDKNVGDSIDRALIEKYITDLKALYVTRVNK